MVASLEHAADVALRKCMKLNSDESLLVIADENKLRIANAFLRQAEKITKKSKLIQIPVANFNGEEPSSHAAWQMKEYDVIVMTTTKSLSWTKAREEACKSGARIASMPGITEETMKRAIDIAYENLKQTNQELARKLNIAQTIEITTSSGTDLRLSVKHRNWRGLDSGIYDKPGAWGNLPSGEIFVAPVEGTAEGTAVIDASMAGIGKLKTPIKVTIRKGFAVEFEGGDEAIKLKKMLESVKSRKAFNIAELGIGTNPKAVVIGNVLEDEKVLGTCHIAFGSNALFGGNIDTQIHVDGVMRKPTIKADGKVIMKNGELF